MKILVTGGAGYIGSHFVKMACKDHQILVVDNLSQTKKNILDEIDYVKTDILNRTRLQKVFDFFKPDVVVHFAAIANVEPSFTDPAYYYRNNIEGTMNVLDAMRKSGCNKIVFSSTAAVYPQSDELITEDFPQKPESPYGYSKWVVERILKDYHVAYGIRSISFRYFNATGLEKGLNCDHKKSQVIPALVRAMKDKEVFDVFGNDFNTPDGTPIRDYIHVNDLATAHLIAIDKLSEDMCSIYNLGLKQGHSVLELIKAAEEILGHQLPHTVNLRRKGDPARLVSDSTKAQRELGWSPKYTDLKDIIRSNYEA